ncbi:hypothetical protein SAMN05660330_00939 [Desulforhopalus singaporensis]|uniref:Uncharacterized protein n=1 Tax=Desulforhopalus singaporensis TaxID=91360 RepID=A0A1H0M149_9BACT|nr:hypothetical protein SAMN05660330_00939 [Desulforhopalus singaporensis]
MAAALCTSAGAAIFPPGITMMVVGCYNRQIMVRALLAFRLVRVLWSAEPRLWNFLQLNSFYLNKDRNIFSKFDRNVYIPAQWRLDQVIDDGRTLPLFRQVKG